ncbi:hypothetical protein PPERSA_01125 [Pseudocohnilembus persalinus]|uniref:Uncharacterized protein n=1 Tax=Pseudocohnilembus persalinus TaxID=266149 RepID=A0A0V0QUQ4_PSEPJ|nr:hypothetical protein PPERSA_01125 [Pseudocohnilembus persalinus]|eukprot:KRX06047.1 hypothetical protein PPERSA_01125 [Pseudocohnilembus persalinus]
MESVNSSKNIEFQVNKNGPKSKRSNIFQYRLDTSQSQTQVKDFMKVILKQKQQYELNRSVSNDKSMNMSINKLKLNSTMNKSKETLKNNLPSKVLDNSILKDVNKVQNPRQNQSIQSNYEKKFNQKQHSTSNIKQYSKIALQQNDLLSPSQKLPRKRIYSEHVGSKQMLNNLIKKNQVRSQKKDNIQNNENNHPYLLDSQQYQQQPQRFRLQQKQFQQTPSKANIHTSKKQKYSLQNSKMHSGLQTPKYNKFLAPINSSKPQSTKQYYRLDQARSQSIQYNPRPVNQSSSAYKADSVYNPHNIPSKREYYLKIKKKHLISLFKLV